MVEAVNVDTSKPDQELELRDAPREGIAEKETLHFEEGDLYDEDTGAFLGNFNEVPEGLVSIPANISLFSNGYWYVYRMDKKYKQPEVQVDTITTTGGAVDEPAA